MLYELYIYILREREKKEWERERERGVVNIINFYTKLYNIEKTLKTLKTFIATVCQYNTIQCYLSKECIQNHIFFLFLKDCTSKHVGPIVSYKSF